MFTYTKNIFMKLLIHKYCIRLLEFITEKKRWNSPITDPSYDEVQDAPSNQG